MPITKGTPGYTCPVIDNVINLLRRVQNEANDISSSTKQVEAIHEAIDEAVTEMECLREANRQLRAYGVDMAHEYVVILKELEIVTIKWKELIGAFD